MNYLSKFINQIIPDDVVDSEKALPLIHTTDMHALTPKTDQHFNEEELLYLFTESLLILGSRISSQTSWRVIRCPLF